MQYSIFFQPIEKRYVDGGMLSNLASYVFNQNDDSIYERILAFTLTSGQDGIHKINSIKDYIGVLASTAVDGSVNVQMKLQKNVHIITIDTGAISATDFNRISDSVLSPLDL